jgi:hypothetical protein
MGIVKVSEDILEWETPQNPTEEPEAALREKILGCVEDDPLLKCIVEYRLDHPDAKARDFAQALGLEMQEIYNANRRLKARLRRLVISTSSTRAKGETAYVTTTQ